MAELCHRVSKNLFLICITNHLCFEPSVSKQNTHAVDSGGGGGRGSGKLENERTGGAPQLCKYKF